MKEFKLTMVGTAFASLLSTGAAGTVGSAAVLFCAGGRRKNNKLFKGKGKYIKKNYVNRTGENIL